MRPAARATAASTFDVGAAAVSVVICAYTLERWGDLVCAVQSVQGQTVPASEIIVVSDHNPQLFERVRETWPDVIALENQQTRGLSGARNTGVAAASGDIIAFLDDDAEAEPGWLAELLAPYSDSTVLGVGGAILPRWAGKRPNWFPEEFDWVVGCTYKGMPEVQAPLRNMIGANMSFRRTLFDTAGGFQNDMGRIGTRPLGCEETELCIRGAQAVPGSRYLYNPAARVHHVVPAHRATWRYFSSRCYSEGLSKAQVSERVGADAGLASERQHAFKTLPAGVFRNVRSALRGDRAGLARAAAIVAGLGITAAGYARGLAARRLQRRRGAAGAAGGPA